MPVAELCRLGTHERADPGSPSGFRGGGAVSEHVVPPSATAPHPAEASGVVRAVDELRTRGVSSLAQGFTREWCSRLRDDIEVAFAEAIERPGGAVPRGPHRFYVEIHPQQLRGFTELMSHPWITGVCEAVLGPDWKAVELGFDIPFPGAADQPWHRDFPSPPETYEQGRLTSLAFNLTAVDTVAEMGPVEIAEGTQWEPGLDFADGM